MNFHDFFLDLKFFPLEYMHNQDHVVFMYSWGKYIKLHIKKNFHKTLFKAHANRDPLMHTIQGNLVMVECTLFKYYIFIKIICKYMRYKAILIYFTYTQKQNRILDILFFKLVYYLKTNHQMSSPETS